MNAPTKPRNARFWVFVNKGSVKLTLRPGQTLHWGKAWDHDEGWCSEGDTWTHDGDRVSRHAWSDGRDCDGRLSTSTDLECDLGRLHAYDCGEGELLPEWQRVSSSQRDYQAEAAGY